APNAAIPSSCWDGDIRCGGITGRFCPCCGIVVRSGDCAALIPTGSPGLPSLRRLNVTANRAAASATTRTAPPIARAYSVKLFPRGCDPGDVEGVDCGCVPCSFFACAWAYAR